MKTRLYVYTGTGNSLWVARQLASELKRASVEFMPCPKKPFKVQAEAVGIIFPVHIWGLPSRVIQIIKNLRVNPSPPQPKGQAERLRVDPETYFFALAVNAGQPAATLQHAAQIISGAALPK